MNNSSCSDSLTEFRDKYPLEKLNLDSTLEDLSPVQCQLEMNCTGNDLEEIFNDSPTIPGIILTENGQFVGMVSRRRFLEVLSRAYGRELFLKRSLYIFYRFAKKDILTLPGNTKIVDAAEQAIQRPSELVYEPIIVEISDHEYGVLASQKVLIAQSSIHQIATKLLQEKTQTQFIQTEKLATLGQLLAGVAHEIRNPVACIVGNLQCLSNYSGDLLEIIQAYEQEFPQSSETLEDFKAEIDLEFIKKDLPEVITSLRLSSQRLSQMVTSLRGYSRTDTDQREKVNLHECLDNTLLILKNRLKSDIQVIKSYDNLPSFSCYPGQISQVFMNLIANAIDAIEENETTENQPKIWIKTEVIEGLIEEKESLEMNLASQALESKNQVLEPNYHNRQSSYCPSTSTGLLTREHHPQILYPCYISIRIIDNGSGISPEIQERIFEDFFTTKPMGKGTGLGLTISHQIITQRHHGKLCLKSTVGEGTEFEILLPLL